MKLKKSLASILSAATFTTSICGSGAFAEKSEPSDKIDKNTRNFGETLKFTDFTFNGEKIQFNTDTSNFKLDLFEDDNLNTALMRGLEFIVNDDSSPYINDKDLIVGGIVKNGLINESIHSTIDYIKTKKENDNDKNLEIFKRLHTIECMIKNDENIPGDNVALKFISGMKSAYQMVISRSTAKEILEREREKIESKIGSDTYTAGGEISSSIPQSGFNIDISTNIGTKQSSTETTFYKIDNSGGLGIGLGAGLYDYLSANVECAFAITNSLIFYSLEEFLDTEMSDGNISLLKIKDEEVKKVVSSRKSMQNAEDEVLSKIETSIGPFLKSANIVPQKLTFKWPEPTDFTTSEKSHGFNIKSRASAAADCLASIGMDVSTDRTINKITITHPYLDLIDEDFLPTEYCEDVSDLVKYLKISNNKKYKEIQNFADKEFGKENRTQKFSAIVSNLTSDIRRYNSVLAIMADRETSEKIKTQAHDVKKSIEQDWVGKGIKHKNKLSRESMLKTAISTGAYLRSLAQSEEEKNLFSSLYTEVKHLSLLQKFTNKTFPSSTYGFNTSRKSDTSSITGQATIDIPLVGATNLSVTYSDTQSPLYTENSRGVTINTQLPMINGKIYGAEDLKENLKKFIKKSLQNNGFSSVILANSFDLVSKQFDNVLSSYAVEKVKSIPMVLSVKDYMHLNFFLTNIPKTEKSDEFIALPDCELIKKDKDQMILKLTKRIDSKKADLKVGVGKNKVKAFSECGKASSKIGSNSLIFIVNKFNVCEAGKNSTGISGFWEKFKTSQKNSIEDLFININDDGSNAKYELQGMYSLIIKNLSKKSDENDTQKQSLIAAVKNLFRNFLGACRDLKESQNNESKQKAYNEAESLFDSILKINYNHVWIPALMKANNK